MQNELFTSYETDVFFDEMFGSDGIAPLDHYRSILNRLKSLEPTQIEEKQKQADSSFLEHGVTFTVYGDDEGTERIFPFDLIPRVIPDKEWQKGGAGPSATYSRPEPFS